MAAPSSSAPRSHRLQTLHLHPPRTCQMCVRAFWRRAGGPGGPRQAAQGGRAAACIVGDLDKQAPFPDVPLCVLCRVHVQGFAGRQRLWAPGDVGSVWSETAPLWRAGTAQASNTCKLGQPHVDTLESAAHSHGGTLGRGAQCTGSCTPRCLHRSVGRAIGSHIFAQLAACAGSCLPSVRLANIGVDGQALAYIGRIRWSYRLAGPLLGLAGISDHPSRHDQKHED